MIREDIKTLLWRGAIFSVYLLVGSGVFSSFEMKTRTNQQTFLKASPEIVNRTRSIFHSMRKNLSQVANLPEESFKAFVQRIIDASKPHQDTVRERWSFKDGLVFSFELVTTIGYGTFPPTTQTGRLLCVFYALFGIPVCLLLLKSIGQVLNKYFNKVVLFIEKRCLHRENPENIARKVIIISCICIVLYIVFFAIIGSLLYKNGTFTDHVYALFITFSTVGFGDIVLIDSEQFDISTNITIIGLVLVSTNVEAILVYLEKREEIRRRHTRGFCCHHNRDLNPSSSCDAEFGNRDGSYLNKGAWTTEMNGGMNIEIDHRNDGMRADGGNGTYRNGDAEDM